MLRTLAILILVAPAAGLAQEVRDIEAGQSLAAELGPGDFSYEGRAFDDYQHSADPGSEARVVVRSGQMTLDVNVYFYDEYFDLLPLVAGGAEAKDSVDFTVPEAGSPVLVVIRVTTWAGDSGPTTGDYTIELSER